MKNVKKLFCPIDFSETSTLALRSAQQLARQFDAAIVVAHVVDEPAYSLAGQVGAQVSALVSEYEDAMQKRLAALAATLDSDLPIQTEIMRGPVAETIARVAEERGCDLIVMATHGRTGVRHMLLGSVTERVLRLSQIPVLTMRAPRA